MQHKNAFKRREHPTSHLTLGRLGPFSSLLDQLPRDPISHFLTQAGLTGSSVLSMHLLGPKREYEMVKALSPSPGSAVSLGEIKVFSK